MSILWCGGEDVDFPNGAAISTVTTSTYFRSAYARCNIAAASGYAYSNAFSGGAITSGWFHFQLGFFPENSNGSQRGSALCAGLGNTASGSSGIYVWSTAGFGLGIAKYDGTTVTVLASGANSTIPNTINVQQCDLQILNYGASSTITLYVNGVQSCQFSGNSAIAGLSNFNCVNLWTSPSGNFGAPACGSEFIVADSTEPTVSMGLKTCAPVATGTTAAWTGVVGNANPTAIADNNAVYVNATTQDEQFTQGGLPSGTWAVRLVKVTSRGAASAGATATKFTPGFNIAGTVTLVGGTTHTPGTSFTNFEDYWTTNPATSTGWVAADVATGNLQLEIQSS
jgi:hypothetical protein